MQSEKRDEESQRTVNLDSVLRGAETADDEELEKIVKENGKKFLGALVVCLLAVWVYHRFQERKVESGAEASRRFQNAQALFAEAILPSQNQNVDRLKAFEDSLRSLESTFKSTAYGEEFAPLYLALQSFRNGNGSATRDRLRHFELENFFKSGLTAKLTTKGALREVAALVYARSWESEDRIKSRGYLEKLAEKGQFAAGEAALALVRGADGQIEHQHSVEILKRLLKSKPELVKELQGVVRELGISLAE